MTDRLEEIERRLKCGRWDNEPNHYDDIAFLLGEVRRLRDENDKFRELTAQELSWQTEAIENHKAAQDAQSLALSLADVIESEPDMAERDTLGLTMEEYDEKMDEWHEKRNAALASHVLMSLRRK